MKVIFAICILVFALGQLAMGAAKESGGDMKAVASDNNAFAFDLYGRLAGEQSNLFFSPYSIDSALAMTYAGAKGETAQEMAQTLHYQMEGPKLHAAMGALLKELNEGGQVGPERAFQLVAANALWAQKGYPFHKDFVDLVKQNYGAGFNEVDFLNATEQARQTINTWVEKQTQDKIKDLIGKGVLAPTSRLVLTNAIYFKSAWAEQFKPANTKEGSFTLSGGKSANVPMMNQRHRFQYAQTDDAQVLTLPYYGYALEMVVVLPKKADGIGQVEKSLQAQLMQEGESRMVELSLPKFKMTRNFELAKVLEGMGMKLALEPNRADFSGICSQEPLFISEVIHKAFVDVNEEGTEAAAATAVVLRAGAAFRPEQPVVFKADHPFFFAIRHRESGAVLFMGRVMDPTAQ
jgi:serpin B